MTWSPEIALLLDATSIHPDEDAVLRIRQRVERGLDWSELLRIAIPHGVLPLLSHNLSAYAASVVPRVTLAQMQLFGKRVADRNREQSLELAKIISAFTREGIRGLPFKGPALAMAAYGDMGVRESHDLDLWVDPLQCARASEWLREAGYHPIRHVQGVARQVSDFGSRHGEFCSPDGRIFIELRGHLEQSELTGFDPAFDEVWDRRGQVSLCSSEIPVLAAEDLLLGLAVHGSKHRWRRLNWIVDVAAVSSSRAGIDWEAMLTRAGEWRCLRCLLVAVALASTLYCIELPQVCSKPMRDLAVCSAVSYIRSSLFREQRRTIGNVSTDVLYRLQCCDSTSERLRCTRNWLRHIVRADETRMALPMSKNLRRVYSAVSRLRDLIGHGRVGPS